MKGTQETKLLKLDWFALSAHQISDGISTLLLLFIHLQLQINFWIILSVKKNKKNLQESFMAGSQPALTICAAHFEQRLKKKEKEYQGEFFLVCLNQPAHKRIGWRSAGTVWILFRGYVVLHYEQQLTRRTSQEPPHRLSSPRPCLSKQQWQAGLKRHRRSNWLDLQLSDNTPTEEMKSWKNTPCSLENHYFDMGLSSHFSGSELCRPGPNITFGKYKLTSTIQGIRIRECGCVLSSDCKVYGQFIRQNVSSNDEETVSLWQKRLGFRLPRAEAKLFADFP